MSDFGAAVARMRAAMGGEWPLPELEAAEGPPADLQARRRAGLEAYTRAAEARGMSRRAAHVWASAMHIFEDLGG